MATITGKRFQMTDGAASPINLFPYTVSEAVYGLNNSISNAISSALSTISLSTYAGTSAIGSSTQPVYYNGSALVACNLSTTYAPYNSAGYLPLTGGTLTGALTITAAGWAGQLAINRSNAGSVFASFNSQGTFWGGLGFSGANVPVLATTTGDVHTIWHANNSNLSTVPWACSGLTIGAPGSYGRIGCPYNESDTNKYNYIEFYAKDNDGDIRYVAGAWTGGDHISHRFLVGLGGSVDALTIKNNGNVGIGTTAPVYKLEVNGSIGCSTLTAVGVGKFGVPAEGVIISMYNNTIDGFSWDYATSKNLHLNYSSAGNVSLCYGGGNVGIGTVSPTQKLHVDGNILSTGNITGYGIVTNEYYWMNDSGGTQRTLIDRIGNAPIFGYGFSAAGYECYYTGYGIHIYAGGGYSSGHLDILPNGNVGIGTTTPAYKLDVNGSIGCSTDITCRRARTNTDWNAINIANIGSWSAANGTIACINVTDGQGTVGRFGVGFDSSIGGFFAVGNFYTSDYGATGYIMTVNAAGVSVTGTINTTGDQIISSDLTLKTNLQDVAYSVPDIAKCRAVTFDWKDGHGHSAGSIAQDWKPLIPELVHGEEGNMTLAYGQIALVNSILEAREIERLKERVAELENQLKMRS